MLWLRGHISNFGTYYPEDLDAQKVARENGLNDLLDKIIPWISMP